MSDLNIQELEKKIDSALTLTGNESFVEWDTFSKNSNEVTLALEALDKKCQILRDFQQKTFISNSKFEITQ